jgi:hypothetical protein
MALDPDEQVRSTVRLVFDRFERRRSARGVLQYLADHDIQLPDRVRSGPSKGEVRWNRPGHATVGDMLRHPAYAGAYVYGRRRMERRSRLPGKPHNGRRFIRAPEQWAVLHRDRWPATIDWEPQPPMNEHEKSDPIVVAMKAPNKAGRPAAERRVGTKGNAGQHNTRRAQNRESVTQALACVRQASRTRKKERFIALLHHIDVDLLRTAFLALQRRAAPGVDGLTWQDYEAEIEPRLADLHARVHRGAYRPQPSRRTYIPKADGKQRPLAIPTWRAYCTSCSGLLG